VIAKSNVQFLAILAAAVLWACGVPESNPDELRSVHVADVHVDPRTESPVVELIEDGDKGRSLSIWVGEFEAESIARAMDNQPSPRPNPHDLLKKLVDRMHGHVLRTLVTELREGTYFAVIELELRGRTVSLDARPSDAIAVALRAGAPLFVRDSLFEPAAEIPDDEHAVEIDFSVDPDRDCPAATKL
jgi:uncharacterized protein